MNDEEIKKALECCVSDNYDESCIKCPARKYKGCDYTLHKNILDLINRQQSEIERLNGNLFTISNACMQRRNEAIKEFAERLKAYANKFKPPVVDIEEIDNFLAEMVGE